MSLEYYKAERSRQMPIKKKGGTLAVGVMLAATEACDYSRVILEMS